MDENQPQPKSSAIGEMLGAILGMAIGAKVGFELVRFAIPHGSLATTAAIGTSVVLFMTSMIVGTVLGNYIRS
jgi:hypothetical protein